MREIENYIQSVIMLLVITTLSIFTTSEPYIFIMLAGVLLIIFTVRSMSERIGILGFVLQLMVSAAFCFYAGNIYAFLVYYELRYHSVKKTEVLIPALFYGVMQMIMQLLGAEQQQLSLPQILLGMLILWLVSSLIYAVEYLVMGYITARTQIAQAISATAVNEMYEKKLNQELVIKNYLADKNARLEERENISRNIHNSVGHSITAAIMTLDAADMLFESSPEKAREKVRLANERIHGSLSSIRHAVRVLDGESKLIGMSDFIKELTAVTDSFMMDTTIQISTDFQGEYDNLMLPHEHTEFLTGALQELLSNGVRHGKADRFVVRLEADSGHVKLSVKDNGTSDFSADNKAWHIENGFGLKKLISYTKKCGGRTEFDNVNGFSADIVLPLMKETEYE